MRPSSLSSSALRAPAAEALMEESQQEIAVEGIELVFARFSRPASAEPVAQVVAIAVQKAFPLDEVDEHQPIEHQRRRTTRDPPDVRDAADEREKPSCSALKRS